MLTTILRNVTLSSQAWVIFLNVLVGTINGSCEQLTALANKVTALAHKVTALAK
jgi:hypothetical protein